MNDLFFIEYKPAKMLGDTLNMRPDTELAHRRLCDLIWDQGAAPVDDMESLIYVCKCQPKDWMRIRGELELKGWSRQQGLFVHNRTMQTLHEGQERYKKHLLQTEKARQAMVKINQNTVTVPVSVSDTVSVVGTVTDRTDTTTVTVTKKEEGAAFFRAEQVAIPENLSSPKFNKAWLGWLADRKERKKVVTVRAAKIQLNKLSKMGMDNAIQAIEEAIEKSWQTVFPPKSSARIAGGYKASGLNSGHGIF